MPRALGLGTYGDIHVAALPDGRFKARARFRDFDGKVRIVSRTSNTEKNAKADLREALATRRGAGGVDVSSSTRVSDLADLWLEQPHNWSTGTARTYGSVVNSSVKPTLGGLRLSEATPAVIARALNAVQAQHPSAAKTARACLSGMFGLAIAHGAVLSNPVRDAPTRITVRGKRARALTADEVEGLTDWLRTDERSHVDQDLSDLVDWLLATGARLGEACAARYDVNADGEPLINLERGTWEINATVVRIVGRGLVVQEATKSATGWRVIPIPPHALDMLTRRREEIRPAAADVVFGSPRARALRDPSNTAADLREALRRYRDETGVDLTWVTSHTFRKTVATRLEEAGFTPRQVADHLGHAHPSMTMDVYFGRAVARMDAAGVLDRRDTSAATGGVGR